MSRQPDPYFVWGEPPYYYGFETHAGEAFHLAERFESGDALCGVRSKRFVTVSIGLESDRVCANCRDRVRGGWQPALDEVPPGAPLIRGDRG